MKIEFEDKSYVEFQASQDDQKIIIVIGAKDQMNNLKNIINSVEITRLQLNLLVGSINETQELEFKEV